MLKKEDKDEIIEEYKQKCSDLELKIKKANNELEDEREETKYERKEIDRLWVIIELLQQKINKLQNNTSEYEYNSDILSRLDKIEEHLTMKDKTEECNIIKDKIEKDLKEYANYFQDLGHCNENK